MRRYLVLITILLLPACGFAPTYGTRGENASSPFVTSGLDQIEIALIPDREGQYLRNALIDRFYKNGTPSAPQYLLEIPKVSENVSDFDITIDSEATRRQLKLSATLNLKDVQSGKKLLVRKLRAITSYNVLESEFSTIVTEQSARDAALNDLARQAERHIALYFTKLK